MLVSVRPYHRIDARTAAEHLPHRERQPAPVEQWIGDGLKSPIPFRSKIGERLLCFSYGWHVVGAPRLEQQHGGTASLRKAAGNDGTGRARSADDKIIGWLKLCREPVLIGLNSDVEFECSADLVEPMMNLACARRCVG